MSPFGYGRGEGADAGHGDPDWICSKEKPNTDITFQSLNPVDGKVTGAGNYPHATTAPGGALDVALEALLASARNSSLIAEMYMSTRDDDNANTSRLDAIVDTLSTATQNTRLIVRMIDRARPQATEYASSSLAIRGLETLAIDAPSLNHTETVQAITFECFGNDTNSNYGRRPHEPDSNSNVFFRDDKSDDEQTLEETDSTKHFSNSVAKDEGRSYFHKLYDFIKLIVLLLLNVVTISVTVEIMFRSLVYIATGDTRIKFKVDRSPEGWLGKAKELAFGPQEELVTIDSFVELFYVDNYVSIIKYLIKKLGPPSSPPPATQ